VPGAAIPRASLRLADALDEPGQLESPAYVMQQLGHASSALALEVYTKAMERKRDTGQRIDALIRGADWAQMGTNGEIEATNGAAAVDSEKKKAPR
jgi:hypothetical protein